MILQYKDKVIEYFSSDKNVINLYFQGCVDYSDAELESIRKTLEDRYVYIAIHQLKSWKQKGDVVLDWYRGDNSIVTFLKEKFQR